MEILNRIFLISNVDGNVTKSINEEEFSALSPSEKEGYVKEWSCVCNECSEKWHYLDAVEKEIDRQIQVNALSGLAFCCNPCVTSASSNANTQLSQQKMKLKTCPKCGSSNVTKIGKYFKKQE